jgi:hypothetical protein
MDITIVGLDLAKNVFQVHGMALSAQTRLRRSGVSHSLLR